MFDLFADRVRIERRILTLVNANKTFNCELTGLTSEAIRSWRNSFSKSEDIQLKYICDQLYMLARLTHSIVNVSDEIFDETDITNIEIHIDALNSMIFEYKNK